MDPAEASRLSSASTRTQIKTLIKDGFIIRKPNAVHSRHHARELAKAKSQGRHTGPGKRKGTKTARTPLKELWMKRIRSLRTELKKRRESGEICAADYRKYYLQAKGNAFKNSRLMGEYIDKRKYEEKRMQELAEQAEALSMKGKRQ